MLTIPKNPERFLFSVAALLLLLTVACSGEESFLGTYQAIPGSIPEYADLVVELKKTERASATFGEKRWFSIG